MAPREELQNLQMKEYDNTERVSKGKSRRIIEVANKTCKGRRGDEVSLGIPSSGTTTGKRLVAHTPLLKILSPNGTV
ncbi:hypothetical protein Trydic_g19630 [Trypoxylus dichotomus]